MKRLLITLFVLVSINSYSQVFDVDTLQYSGDINKRINLVIMGDGYQTAELPQFQADASSFMTAFFNETPFSEYQNYFNVFIINVISNESGASHPGTANDVLEPAHPVSSVNNYFGSRFDYFNIHRLLVSTNGIAINNVLATNFPSYDQALILVNSPYYGGAGGTHPSSSTHVNANGIAIHELGHSFSNLSDEYYAGDIYAGESANMTQETNPALVKWTNWHGDNGIGIYQHCCGGNSSQWYRPHQACKMRYLSSPFCSVCTEATIEIIHGLASPIDDYTPSNTTINSPVFPLDFMLDLIHPNPNTLKTEWTLNAANFDSNKDSVQVIANDLIPGTNTLTVTVEDTTGMLRIDNHSSTHLYSVTWTIEYSVTGVTISDVSQEAEIRISPNPATNVLNFEFVMDNNYKKRIELVNALGKKVKTINLKSENEISVDVSNLPAGTYLANFYSGNQFVTQSRVVKN